MQTDVKQARASQPAKRRRPPKKVTLERLKRQALYYLERYNATQASLRAVLRRKVMKAAREHPDTDIEQAHTWIETVIDECARIGLVNDANFALSRARSLLRSGKSSRAVSMALRQKGVADDHIRAAFERLEEEQMEEEGSLDLEAARNYARKRRLGGFRQPIDPDRYDKDLAALARRGFPFALAKTVLDETFNDKDDI